MAFSSFAANLHPDDADTSRDVFLRDLEAGTTTLVSRAEGSGGVKGDVASWEPSISAGGRFVAFHSLAMNLHPDDTDPIPDVFARDLQTSSTTLVSRSTAGPKGDGGSFEPAISGNGRFVAFDSAAANLHADDTDATTPTRR